MGLFDKKNCDVCGEKIGLLGNRKLEDGNLCKDCAKKLSPWCDDRRHSTVEEIKAQLTYREQNKEVLKNFRPTKDIGGNSYHLYVDEPNGQFVVARRLDKGDNPDVIPVSQIVSCNLNVHEDKREEFTENAQGERVSYHPPRYEYSYDYYVSIGVRSPYFDEIKFKLNNFSIKEHDRHERSEVESIAQQMVGYITQVTGCQGGMNGMGMAGMGVGMGMGMAGMGMNNMNMGGMNNMNMGGMNNMGNMQQGGMNNMQQGGMNNMGNMQQSAGGQWTCPACGASNTANFCESCGTPRK